MEYIWYLIAALGAGVGTGLVGLSAATVMVPVLIVLCPSFAGETGVYQATAIALASDILGSAVTTATYIKHKNIDLRRGWIMLVCIIGMCTLGSFAAWKAGSVVLGGFTLILTFCIGIRFLVKPTTERELSVAKGTALDWKGVAVSLFFGLTIGFGTGFVGTGGGMMMLVVFTAFLGMDLKSAVGTSTFIMTFTAFIASVSHILIHPAILMERWPVLLLCIVVTTAASLVSARFANQVDNRTVGLSAGVVLTVLGAELILLHYWDFIATQPLVCGVLCCTGKFLGYIGIGAALALLLRRFVRIPPYVFRKVLHLIAFTSLVAIQLAADMWYAASLTAMIFAALIYPILYALEGCMWYDKLFVQKEPGEIKKSLLLLFLMGAALIALCWGGLDKPYISITSVIAWGTGDAAAALVGKKFGTHHIHVPHADPMKTWEGSGAMMVTAFVTTFTTLLIVTDLSVAGCLLTAVLVAPASAAAELFSHNGNDTVSVPVAIAAVLYLLSNFIR